MEKSIYDLTDRQLLISILKTSLTNQSILEVLRANLYEVQNSILKLELELIDQNQDVVINPRINEIMQELKSVQNTIIENLSNLDLTLEIPE